MSNLTLKRNQFFPQVLTSRTTWMKMNMSHGKWDVQMYLACTKVATCLFKTSGGYVHNFSHVHQDTFAQRGAFEPKLYLTFAVMINDHWSLSIAGQEQPTAAPNAPQCQMTIIGRSIATIKIKLAETSAAHLAGPLLEDGAKRGRLRCAVSSA